MYAVFEERQTRHRALASSSRHHRTYNSAISEQPPPMASATESIQRSPFTADHLSAGIHRSIPILPSSSSPTVNRTPDPMDLTPSNTMGPPQSSSPIADRNASSQHLNPDSEPTVNGNGGGAAVGAAAAAQQPKVVQTAFIHKLYK